MFWRGRLGAVRVWGNWPWSKQPFGSPSSRESPCFPSSLIDTQQVPEARGERHTETSSLNYTPPLLSLQPPAFRKTLIKESSPPGCRRGSARGWGGVEGEEEEFGICELAEGLWPWNESQRGVPPACPPFP